MNHDANQVETKKTLFARFRTELIAAMLLSWFAFIFFPQNSRPPSQNVFLIGNVMPTVLSALVLLASLIGLEHASRIERRGRLLLIVLSILCLAAIISFRLDDWFNPRVSGPLHWILK